MVAFATTSSAGALVPGQLADLCVPSKDFFAVPEEEIKTIESDLTVVGGRVVYAARDFAALDPGAPPASPDWSPVARFGGAAPIAPGIGHFRSARSGAACPDPSHRHARGSSPRVGLGCSCFLA